MRIIGLDPGLRHTGWGIIELKNNRLLHIDDGRISPSTNLDEGDRLLIIRNKLKEIVDNYNPSISAIEQIFVGYGMGSSLKLGMARGVSILVLAEASLIINIDKKLLDLTSNIDFAELCITSSAEIFEHKNKDIKVATTKAKGNKCSLCWKIKEGKCFRNSCPNT